MNSYRFALVGSNRLLRKLEHIAGYKSLQEEKEDKIL